MVFTPHLEEVAFAGCQNFGEKRNRVHHGVMVLIAAFSPNKPLRPTRSEAKFTMDLRVTGCKLLDTKGNQVRHGVVALIKHKNAKKTSEIQSLMNKLKLRVLSNDNQKNNMVLYRCQNLEGRHKEIDYESNQKNKMMPKNFGEARSS